MISPPWYLRLAYPGVTWRLDTDSNVMYLTFDDGPVPEVTPRVLDLLDQYHAKATFFCVGQNVERNPSIYEAIVKRGHSTGNHTYHHLNAWKVSVNEYLEDIERAADVIPSNLFRPPYGRITWPILNALKNKYKVVMWDVISGDYDIRLSHDVVYDNIIQHTRNGSIVVLHDSVKAAGNMLSVLPKMLEYYGKRNIAFKTLDAS